MYSNSYDNIRMMFWDGTEKDDKGKTIVYNFDKIGIEHSVWRALRDYTARTEGKKDGESSASADKMIKAIPEFIKELNIYFERDIPYALQNEYDEWHHQMCDLFIYEITKSKIRSEVKYGKAQKIVNMSMKTVYCLNGADKKAKEGYFKFCHMPLDSITLNWFRNYVAEDWFNVEKKRDQRIKISLEGGPLPKWSSLTFVAAEDFKSYCDKISQYSKDNPYDYMFIVTMISEYFKQETNPYYDLTPFEAEFYIWPETQYEMAADALIKQNLLKNLQSNVGVSVNNVHIKSLNKAIAYMLLDISTYY